ncbi:MAG: heme-binding protein [Hydrogenophaga sp.]
MLKPFLVLLIAVMPLFAQATEEPDFNVVRQLNGAEVREYPAYVVAEVLVPGPADEAGSQAFPLLAGYIFGKNKGDKKFAMTAPVTQVAAPVKLEMTAPVTQAATPEGFVVQFVLPKGVTLETSPEPLDARVKLREVPTNRVAVVRYSGRWSQSNYDEHLAKLQAALRAEQLTWVGEPILSRYDPPITPWFMRRNEIWLSLPPALPSGEPK